MTSRLTPRAALTSNATTLAEISALHRRSVVSVADADEAMVHLKELVGTDQQYGPLPATADGRIKTIRKIATSMQSGMALDEDHAFFLVGRVLEGAEIDLV